MLYILPPQDPFRLRPTPPGMPGGLAPVSVLPPVGATPAIGRWILVNQWAEDGEIKMQVNLKTYIFALLIIAIVGLVLAALFGFAYVSAFTHVPRP